eukprot:1215702-Heterocapsa_arctica.AAC.1
MMVARGLPHSRVPPKLLIFNSDFDVRFRFRCSISMFDFEMLSRRKTAGSAWAASCCVYFSVAHLMAMARGLPDGP